MKSVLFIHRSVGRNLLADGGVYGLVDVRGAFSLSDYDQNTDTLHPSASMPHKLGLKFPSGDTKPADYAAIFSATTNPAYAPVVDLAMTYDVLVIKSCYPNSQLADDAALQAAKTAYQTIAGFFALHPEKHLVIMTTPPLRHNRTDPAAAARARALATWLATTPHGSNVSVFNFFDLLANPENAKDANTLYGKYCRWWPFDSHPNKVASKAIAPLLVDAITQAVR